MTIDTNELRRLAQAATPHVGHACEYSKCHWLREGHVDFENADLFIASERPQEDAAFYAAASPQAILELLDRLGAIERECDALRAKIKQMEKQEPICRAEDLKHAESLLPTLGLKPENPLYAIPGAQAQPAPSIPDDVMRDAKRYRFLRAAKNIPISTEAARDPIVYDAAIDAAMLAAAPEAKP